MTPNDVCVVIPVLNEAQSIEAAIESVREAGQIIVVDGGSTDQTVERVQKLPDVTLLISERGRGRQLSVGAQRCERDVLLFLHADCRLEIDAIQKMIASIERGKHWGAFKQKIEADGIQYRLLEMGNAARVKLLGKPFGDQAMFMTKAIYRESGGFENIPLMEDVRLAIKLRRQSWPVLSDAHVYVSARRWQKRGVLRQTIRNGWIQCLHACGVEPERLTKMYR